MGKEKEIKIQGPDGDESGHQDVVKTEDMPETDSKSTKPDDNGEAESPVELSEEDQLRARVEELDERLLRTLADFENFRKRAAQRQCDLIQSANDRLIGELLEVMDNFERALHHAEEDNNEDVVRQGMELIHGQIKEILGRYRVRPIDALGKPFDPAYHEALMEVKSDEYEAGTIAIEMTKGYMIGDRVLRHSKVGVSRGQADEDVSNSDKNSGESENGDSTK